MIGFLIAFAFLYALALNVLDGLAAHKKANAPPAQPTAAPLQPYTYPTHWNDSER